MQNQENSISKIHQIQPGPAQAQAGLGPGWRRGLYGQRSGGVSPTGKLKSKPEARRFAVVVAFVFRATLWGGYIAEVLRIGKRFETTLVEF